MEGTPSSQTSSPGQAKPNNKIGTAGCWFGGIACIVGGFSSAGWTDELCQGWIIAAAGVVLFPPVLRQIRSRLPFTRPWYVPFAYFLLLPFVALIIGKQFSPSPSEQRRLMAVAVEKAQSDLASGDYDGAEAALRKFHDRGASDPRLAALYAQLDKRPTEQLTPSPVPPAVPSPAAAKTMAVAEQPQSAEANWVERVQTYWLPQVRAIPTTAITDDDDFRKRQNDLNVLVQNFQDGDSLTLTKPQKATRDQFKAALAAKQARLFPALRRGYSQMLNQKLFRDDVSISVTGPSAQTIRFTAGMFVQNANIEDMQQGEYVVLMKLRFRRADYRWSRFIADGYHYDLKPPSDAAIGITNDDGSFTRLGGG